MHFVCTRQFFLGTQFIESIHRFLYAVFPQDIRGKHLQRPLYDLLSSAMSEAHDGDPSSDQTHHDGVAISKGAQGPKRSSVPAYASLLPYGNAALVAANATDAVARGFQSLKLHEV
jgi:hypothetical protein